MIQGYSDPINLAKQLIQCVSITPNDGGAIALVQNWLTNLGFKCYELDFKSKDSYLVKNLFAYYEVPESLNLCFAGHIDVVPPGNLDKWIHYPFSGIIDKEKLYGRGAEDMKGGIACFISAIAEALENKQLQHSISFIITSDEEGLAIDGTSKVLQWLEKNNINLDFCLVGEPTSKKIIADTIKIGRRGSINTHLVVTGKQGHVAFPQEALNPISILIQILQDLKNNLSKHKNDLFDESNLEITSFDVNNLATNVIPESASANFNIRFNDQYKGNNLKDWINEVSKKYSDNFICSFYISGEAEFVPPDKYINKIANIVHKQIGTEPSLSTQGGTSDARFIREYCPVIELGLIRKTMHQVNENVNINDLKKLKIIYQEILKTNIFN